MGSKTAKETDRIKPCFLHLQQNFIFIGCNLICVIVAYIMVHVAPNPNKFLLIQIVLNIMSALLTH